MPFDHDPRIVEAAISPVAKLLLDAADLIEQKGHAKQYFATDANGENCWFHSNDAVAFCARGALYRAGQTSLAFEPVVQSAVIAVSQAIKGPVYTSEAILVRKHEEKLAYWNNKAERTGADVTRLFRQVARQI